MDEQKLLRQLRPWLGAVARNRTAEAMRKQNVYLPLEDDTLITLDRIWEQMVEKERCARCRTRIGRSFTGFTICRRQPRRSRRTYS